MPALKNAKHEAFSQEIAKGETAEEAYIRAGFKPNRGNATRLKQKDSIRARVAEILGKSAERAEITIGRVLQELARVGTSDIRDALTENGALKHPNEWSDEFAAAVASIEVVTRTLPGQADDELDAQPHGGALARKRNPEIEYIHKIRLWDKNSALEKIAKHFGMFIERHEHNVSAELAELLKAVDGKFRGIPTRP